MARSQTLRLNPETIVLHRRNGDVQFGWDPDSAVVVAIESSADRRAVLELIRLLDGTLPVAVAVRRAAEAGLPTDRSAQIISDLRRSGHIVGDRSGSPRTVRVHGDGPLAESISARLSATSVSVVRSRSVRTLADVRRWTCDLVVLADSLVWDPSFIAELLDAGLVHLQVRVRDGKGIVGPLVHPGVSSCLLCADLTRSEFDPEWPLLASQLLGKVGLGSPEIIMATTSFAISEIHNHFDSEVSRETVTPNATVEICTNRLDTGRRHWPIHPDCRCQNLHNHPRRLADTVS
ncbi:hypothetical protein [Smaragdicoccus niigatensis]|uniref:hypothetical protein n=1 Tax=Smaragdicoccus niigatensis TaxID=359359 RepID=UPI000367CC5E|nr:hypothetical protein [Smaragdicoccus niigatensis]